MTEEKKWKRISRKTIYSSPFIELFEDNIQLPNGDTIPDYTVIKKPDVVLIFATNEMNEVLVLKEYKYAVDEYLWTVPAGHISPDELPLDAAKRELFEETGYQSDEMELVTTIYEFPSKDSHKVFVVRAKNAKKVGKTVHEATEFISKIQFISKGELKNEVKNGKWKAAAVIAGFTVCDLL